MSTSLLEIVDLGDGEVVLQRVEGDSEPLVSIQFSDEANAYLMGNNLEIAKVMIQAGIEAAAQLAEVNNLEVETAEMSETRTLHSPRSALTQRGNLSRLPLQGPTQDASG